MNTVRLLLSPATSFAACLLLAAPAAAVPVNHGNFPGTTVTYGAVTETTFTGGDADQLFGPPTVSRDLLDFNPPVFTAFSQAGSSEDATNSSLSFTAESVAGHGIVDLEFIDIGDVLLTGFGNDITAAAAQTLATIHIDAVDGAPINRVSFQSLLVFSPSGGNFGQLTDGGGGPLFTSVWTGTLLTDIEQKLVDAAIPFVNGASRIAVTLDMSLQAASQAATTAHMQRKDFKINAVTESSTGLNSDFNNNGVADAADYVVWREGLGTTFTDANYNNWRAHFGQTTGSSSSASLSAQAVPEPSTWLTLAAIAAWHALSPRRRAW